MEKLKQALACLRELKDDAYEVARGIEDVFAYDEKRFLAVHAERQKAATVAQRRYESATGLPLGPVPLQAPIPEYGPSESE